jgi:putative alpha-1,2-mannosidase
MMRLYLMSDQDVHLILPSSVKSLITNPHSGNTATIRSYNFDAAYMNIYIQSTTLNGRAYTKSWLTHKFFTEGGILELTLGPHEIIAWGVSDEHLLPSASAHSWRQ